MMMMIRMMTKKKRRKNYRSLFLAFLDYMDYSLLSQILSNNGPVHQYSLLVDSVSSLK